jgi:hypothetical protein
VARIVSAADSDVAVASLNETGGARPPFQCALTLVVLWHIGLWHPVSGS